MPRVLEVEQTNNVYTDDAIDTGKKYRLLIRLPSAIDPSNRPS